MSSVLKKTTDQFTKDTVYGYLKKQQSLLPRKSINTIPSLVQHLILAYIDNVECFNKRKHGSCMKVNENADCFKYFNLNGWQFFANSIYGNIRIGKNLNNNYYNKFIWFYEIINPSKDLCISIGLDSSPDYEQHVNTSFDSGINRNMYYSFECHWSSRQSRIRCKQFIPNQRNINYKKYGCCYAQPEYINIVAMEFDTKRKTLRYFINGYDQGIAVHNISFDNNEQYVAAISVNNSVTVKLVKFQQLHA